MFTAIKNDPYLISVAIALIAAVAVVYKIFKVNGIIDIVLRRSLNLPETKQTYFVPLDVTASGLVWIKEVHIQQVPHEKLTVEDYRTQGYDSHDMIKYVFPLTYESQQAALRAVAGCGMNSDKGKSIRWALTLASSLYEFPIPEPFVLLDATTARLYLYFINKNEGALISHWMKSVIAKSTLEATWNYNRQVERGLALTTDDFEFIVQKLLPIASERLMCLSLEKIFPYVGRVVEDLMRDHRLAWTSTYQKEDGAKVEYMNRTAVSIASQILQIKVPMYYLHFCPLAQRVLNVSKPAKALKVSPAKPRTGLRVVANNPHIISKESSRGKL